MARIRSPASSSKEAAMESSSAANCRMSSALKVRRSTAMVGGLLPSLAGPSRKQCVKSKTFKAFLRQPWVYFAVTYHNVNKLLGTDLRRDDGTWDGAKITCHTHEA